MTASFWLKLNIVAHLNNVWYSLVMKSERRCLKLIKVAENEVIINKGEINELLYKVVSGSFAIYMNYGQDNEYLLGVLGKGKCFGESGFLAGQESPYTVIANQESLVLDVDKEHFQDFIVNNPRNAIDIMTSMSKMVCLLQKHVELLIDESNVEGEKKEQMTRNLMDKIRQYQSFKF